MEILMSGNYQDKYYDERMKNIARDAVKPIEDDVDALIAREGLQDQDISKLMAHVFKEVEKRHLPQWYNDPIFMKVILAILTLVLTVVGLFVGDDLTRLLK